MKLYTIFSKNLLTGMKVTLTDDATGYPVMFTRREANEKIKSMQAVSGFFFFSIEEYAQGDTK
jgi:hypothetical protein